MRPTLPRFAACALCLGLGLTAAAAAAQDAAPPPGAALHPAPTATPARQAPAGALRIAQAPTPQPAPDRAAPGAAPMDRPAQPAPDAPATASATPPAPASARTPSGAATATATAPQAGTAPAPALTPDPGARAPALPLDLSIMGMVRAADPVVKAVMAGLVLASVATWTVLVVKLITLGAATAQARRAARRIEAATTLPAALAATGARRDPASLMVRAAAREYDRSRAAIDQSGGAGVRDRIASHLGQIAARAGRAMARGTGALATIGATAPFVGLFGTVWGIMNSFIGIADSQTTTLAVVAPGIAEALLATALGLVAAIPAVVFYNGLARAITGYRLTLAEAAAATERLVSRDLDLRPKGGA